MWFKNSFRRHLCDMHIDDWNEEFLSKFSPEEYLENLKKAKVNNAMLYFQSHVGLCYYPTKSGKIHNAFVGREDMMKRLAHMCRKNNIAVTGYYSLVYNNWAYNAHPEWRIRSDEDEIKLDFASEKVSRYGRCCPNNPGYRRFVSVQLKEIADYFEFDGMFFDMLFWSKLCVCEYCRARFKNETGCDLPKAVDEWNNPMWLLHLQKRREWIGDFAQSVSDEMKSYAPGISVEHNVANAVVPQPKLACAEEVINACDYAGGDLYGGLLRQSFACKFYRNITKNQPFEYMFSRCEPNLTKHTVTKSLAATESSNFLTLAHHGATLVIDAIDPVGTLDKRVYERVGAAFEKSIPYEKYIKGEMIEDVGIYYTLKSKFNAHGEQYTNFTGATNTVKLMINNNICCGVTGGYHDINTYNLLIAPCLTEEDRYDYDRIETYVQNGGNLYISGGDCLGLIKKFFGAEITERTRETVVYIAPNTKAEKSFGWFNSDYPLHFDAAAPVAKGIDTECVLAALTFPYTPQDTDRFASIHSNPPGIKTDIPAVALKRYGKGKVLWSALPIESMEKPYQYGKVFLSLLREFLDLEQTISSTAPQDVEIVAFKDEGEITVSSVQLCEGETPHKVEMFDISVKTDKMPKRVLKLPNETECKFKYENGTVTLKINDLNIFDMKKIIL